MDIVLSTKDSGGLFDRDKYETVFLFNNFYNDAFSLKSLGTRSHFLISSSIYSIKWCMPLVVSKRRVP